MCGVVDDPTQLIISADTVVIRDNEVLEKPSDEAHAKAMLRSLSGRKHDVATSVHREECLKKTWTASPVRDRAKRNHIGVGRL